MPDIQARTLQGFSDYLPREMILRQYVKDTWMKIFRKYGYGQLETPSLEYADILKGKYGEEEKLIYQFEDRGGREVALRYDQTVPLARAIAQHANEIKLPFKRFEINRVWRADAARKGRKREFYQCDIDIVGTDSLLADAEMVAVLSEGFKELGFKDYIILLNNRKIIQGFVKSLTISEEKEMEVLRAADKLDKIGIEGVKKELKDRGVPNNAISKILDYLNLKDKNALDMLSKLKKMLSENEAKQGIEELEKLISYINHYKIPKEHYEITPSMVRGLDYYTGNIIEVISPSFGQMSLAGGGRYDKLCGIFAGRDIEAVGIAVGFEPICIALEEMHLGPTQKSTAAVLVTIFSEDTLDASIELAESLRKNDIETELYFASNHKLGKQFEYANKHEIPYVLVLGPDEVKNGMVVIKNMKTGDQKEVTKRFLYASLRKRTRTVIPIPFFL